VLCTTVVHNDMHTREQFLNFHIGLGLDFVFVYLFRFTVVVFCVSLDHFITVACILGGLFRVGLIKPV